MKRLTALLLAIIMLTPLLNGCGANKQLDAVIILPGIMGSELFLEKDTEYSEKKFEADTKLWLNLDKLNQIFAIPEHIEMLDPSLGYNIRTADPIVNNYDIALDYGTLNTYAALYDALYYEFGEECDVIFYSYDWRKGPNETALEFDSYLKEQGYDRISIVAHSMGGLVASHFFAMGKEQRKKVDTYLSLGTPYLGSEQATYAMITGNIDSFFANLIVSNKAKELCPKLDSMYALLPYEHMWQSNISVFLLTGTSPSVSFTGENALLAKYIENYSNSMHDNAEEQKSLLFTKKGKHITELVNSYYLVGNGEKTVVTVNIPNDPRFTSTLSTVTKSPEGDGTVSLYSATIGGTLPSNRTFVKTSKDEFRADHLSLANGSDTTTLRFIIQVLRGKVNKLSDSELQDYYNIKKNND